MNGSDHQFTRNQNAKNNVQGDRSTQSIYRRTTKYDEITTTSKQTKARKNKQTEYIPTRNKIRLDSQSRQKQTSSKMSIGTLEM